MKITAVVVTYNRLELLKHGIECLRKQRQLSKIIIVNNGSTDGTTEWLKGIGGMASQVSTASKEPNIDVINQENVGGSGGFYTGIKAAFDDGADWIWCMDDDVFGLSISMSLTLAYCRPAGYSTARSSPTSFRSSTSPIHSQVCMGRSSHLRIMSIRFNRRGTKEFPL